MGWERITNAFVAEKGRRVWEGNVRRDELGRVHPNQDGKDTDNQLPPQLGSLEAEQDWQPLRECTP